MNNDSGSKVDELQTHLYVPNRNVNITALNELFAALIKANIKPNLISNKAYNQLFFHAPAQPLGSFLSSQRAAISHVRSLSPTPSSSPPVRVVCPKELCKLSPHNQHYPSKLSSSVLISSITSTIENPSDGYWTPTRQSPTHS